MWADGDAWGGEGHAAVSTVSGVAPSEASVTPACTVAAPPLGDGSLPASDETAFASGEGAGEGAGGTGTLSEKYVTVSR